MSTALHTLHVTWARAHRSAVLIALLALALAVTAGVFVLGLATGNPPVAATSVSSDHPQRPTDNGCQQDLPGIRGVMRAC